LAFAEQMEINEFQSCQRKKRAETLTTPHQINCKDQKIVPMVGLNLHAATLAASLGDRLNAR